MPLIILCLIVVVCGLLLFYYQLGPKMSRRIGDGFGRFGAGNPSGDVAGNEGEQTDNTGDSASGATMDFGRQDVKSETKGDGKVMFVYGDGEREERPLDAEDKSDQ